MMSSNMAPVLIGAIASERKVERQRANKAKLSKLVTDSPNDLPEAKEVILKTEGKSVSNTLCFPSPIHGIKLTSEPL